MTRNGQEQGNSSCEQASHEYRLAKGGILDRWKSEPDWGQLHWR